MKHRPNTLTVVSVLCSVLFLAGPFNISADELTTPVIPVVLPQIIITEVQTAMPGSGNASKEFIELYNTTDQPIDLSDWELWYISASSTNLDQPTRRIAFTPSESGPQVIGDGDYFVLSGHIDHLADVRDLLYEATLATNGHLRLMHQAEDYLETCQLLAEDSVSWGTAVPPTGLAASAPAAGSSVERMLSAEGYYIDTDNSSVDFLVVPVPTPKARNSSLGISQSLSASPLTVTDPGCVAQLPPEDDPPSSDDSPPSTTVPPEDEEGDPLPVIPAGNLGLKPPQISELLANPGPPKKDANDEFIELYNPNSKTFDLSNYVLEVGLKTKRRYIIPPGTKIGAKKFLAFFSTQTNLALSNTGSQVFLVDPLGQLLLKSKPYEKAKDDQAWLLANGSWQWTTRPTPNGLNVVSKPVAKKSKSASSNSNNYRVGGANVGATDSPASRGLEDTANLAATPAPLHPGVLAAIAVSALLYGAYEYRHDAKNKLYQLRKNRAARRELRQGSKGR